MAFGRRYQRVTKNAQGVLNLGKFEEEKEQLWFLNMHVQKEKAYFSAGWFNGLIEADMTTGEAKIIAKFPNERELVGDLQQEILYYNEKLYFCPRSTNWLYIFDLSKREMKAFDLPENTKYWKEREIKFGKVILRDNDLYIFPMNYNQILRFDIEKEEFTVYEDWFAEFQKLTNYKEKRNTCDNFFCNFMVYEDTCVWSIRETNILCVFDIKESKLRFMEHRFGNIVSVEKKTNPLFLCEDGRCWRYDEDKKEIIYVENWDVDVTEIFAEFIMVDGKCYFPSLRSNELLVYDLEAQSSVRIEFETDGKGYQNSIGRRWKRPLLFVRYAEDKMYLLNQYNELIVFDIKSGDYDRRRFKLTSQEEIKWDWDLWIDNSCSKYTYFPYNSDSPEAVMYIIKKEEQKAERDNCGKKIWECVKECLLTK